MRLRYCKLTLTAVFCTVILAARDVRAKKPRNPFDCGPHTVSDELDDHDLTVIAELVETVREGVGGEAPIGRFRIVHVLRGKEHLPPTGEQPQVVETWYYRGQPGRPFLLTAYDAQDVDWQAGGRLSAAGVHYVKRVAELPADCPKQQQLEFFVNYLDDEDRFVADDAHHEFGRASYRELKAQRENIDRERVLARLQDSECPAEHRAMFWRLLGLAGTAEDLPMLERQLAQPANGYNDLLGLIKCYLTLRGSEGLPVIEKRFLASAEADLTAAYCAVQAIRLHGYVERVIPRKRLSQSLHLVLDHSELADLVVPDLARWEDWSVVDRLGELFKGSNDKDLQLRSAVIRYLHICPQPRAKELLKELIETDPKAAEVASFFLPSGTPPIPIPVAPA